MRAPHLVSALLASGLVAAALFGWTLYARSVEGRYVHALAAQLFPIKMQGIALQAEAFRQQDLLPLYGSSEFDSFVGPYHASELFQTFPTGFAVFLVGAGGTTPLIVLQRMAAIGSELQGKKIAICLSPTFFHGDDRVRQSYYGGNFSVIQANLLAFSSELSFGLKQEVARRMVRYPSTLERSPLLRFSLERLAENSPINRALYYAVFPLGKLQNLILRLQDHWETLALIRLHPELGIEVPRRPLRPDWSSLQVDAEREAQQRSDSNPFGFDNQYWVENGQRLTSQRGRNSDRLFLQQLSQETDWTDLELLLRGLRELGAQPLLLSVPIKGVYYDYWGVSARAREAFYRKLRSVVAPYDVPLLDFEDHDADAYFTADDRSHPNQKGWLFYDRALDAFYHDRLGRSEDRDARPSGTASSE